MKYTFLRTLTLTTLLFSSTTLAYCFDEAGQRYNVSPKLLKAIAKVESSLNHKAINRKNNNGSSDYGLMQINEQWLNRLSKHNITTDDLLNNACLNVNIGAWILALNFKSHGHNWNSVGAYNAGFSKNSQKQRDIYIAKVKAKL